MSKMFLELELVELEDGSAHSFSYIKADIKEFFENFGWKVVSSSADESEDEE